MSSKHNNLAIKYVNYKTFKVGWLRISNRCLKTSESQQLCCLPETMKLMHSEEVHIKGEAERP